MSTLKEEDLISRISGDEFIIVFEETCREELETISSRIIGSIGNPYFLADKEAHVTPSIGIALFPEHGDEIDSIVDHADKAMYAAKNNENVSEIKRHRRVFPSYAFYYYYLLFLQAHFLFNDSDDTVNIISALILCRCFSHYSN
jgi:Diguanylate cyclase, GGDEF domain